MDKDIENLENIKSYAKKMGNYWRGEAFNLYIDEIYDIVESFTSDGERTKKHTGDTIFLEDGSFDPEIL